VFFPDDKSQLCWEFLKSLREVVIQIPMNFNKNRLHNTGHWRILPLIIPAVLRSALEIFVHICTLAWSSILNHTTKKKRETWD